MKPIIWSMKETVYSCLDDVSTPWDKVLISERITYYQEMIEKGCTHMEYRDCELNFYQSREETDEEYNLRVLQENDMAVRIELSRRKQWEELKKIYGN